MHSYNTEYMMDKEAMMSDRALQLDNYLRVRLGGDDKKVTGVE